MSDIEMGVPRNNGINPYLQLCERSSCCRNMFFIYLSKKQLKTLTPENTHVVKFDSVLDLPSRKDLKFMQNGVYYAESAESSYYAAAIAGPCANLGQDGECLVYQERPTHCRRFETGSSDCDKARQKDGLVPVQELIQLSPRI